MSRVERLNYECCIAKCDRQERVVKREQCRVTKIKYCSARMHSHQKHVEKRRKTNKVDGQS